MSDLAGKTAVVTGGASGIGEALVTRLTERGANVLAVDLDAAGLDRMADASGCETMSVDVSSREANDAIMAAAVESFGGLDMAFLNAGVLDRPVESMRDPYRVSDIDWGRYELVRGVLVDAVIHGTVAATAAMGGSGAIVATASAAGLVGWEPTPVYCASKHAVVGWVRAIAPALERDGVTIAAICPGGIATPLVGRTAADAGGRLLSPTQVADAMIDAAQSGETGQAISVVGGRDPVAMVHEFADIPGFP